MLIKVNPNLKKSKKVKKKPKKRKKESLHFHGNFCQHFHLLPIFQFNVGNPTPPYMGVGMTPSQAKDKDGSLHNPTTSGDFKTPLTTVTAVENLAIVNTAVPKSKLSSKIEVSPNRTDKTDADVKDTYFDLFE